MIELKNISTEDILTELERRNQEAIDNDHFLCMGLIDNDGAESLMPVKTKETFASLHSSLSLRARFNSQRIPVMYVVNITQPMYEEFDRRLLKGEYVKVGEELKKLSTFKRLGY